MGASSGSTAPEARIASRDDWLAARRDLLEKEKAFTRARDALSAARRALPVVQVEQSYAFDTVRGRETLADLFGSARQLILYHFMFGPDWDEGCPSCSFFADSFDRSVDHLAARGTRFACVSNAPLQRLQDYRARLGWSFDWVSCNGSTFGADFGVTFPDDAARDGAGYNYGARPFGVECPGLSVFVKLPDGGVAHAYSVYARGLDILNTTYNLLDHTFWGRDEEALDYPMSWVRRRDQY